MTLVIHSFGGGHTHTHTRTDICWTEAILRNQEAPGLTNARFPIFLQIRNKSLVRRERSRFLYDKIYI